jgi:hypothetical protein
MPFPTQTASAFSRPVIEAITPDQMGCYGLFRQGTWIYIGKGDIRTRLLDHLNGGNPCIASQGPTHFYTVVTSDYDNKERRLILECKPVCNQKVG